MEKEDRLHLIMQTQEYIDMINNQIQDLKELREQIIPDRWCDYQTYKVAYNKHFWKEYFNASDKRYIKETHKELKEVLYKI